ncbi:MAG: hypothetical protein HRU38_22605 [Saccharospirillaceae bacterium]|nr:hypothetical protein [Saccharospirillaceae bacterium]
MQKSVYSLVLINSQAAFFKQNVACWVIEPISGETWNDVENELQLKNIITKFNARQNSENDLKQVSLHVTYDDACNHLLSALATSLYQHQCNDWQLFCYKPLLSRVSVSYGLPDEDCLDNYLVTKLLPLLSDSFNYQDDSLIIEKQRAELSHQDDMATLQHIKSSMEQQIQVLRQQVNIQHKLDLEQLLCFLPLFYKNVWNTLTPQDLAILSGNLIQEINIKSPYHEPDKNTVLVLKKRFTRLSDSHQQSIIQFCHTLEHPLSIRHEMSVYLESM